MIEAIGKFQLSELIGKGATASVYLSKDPFTGQDVAIKIANQSVFSDPVHGDKFKKMFMNEASLAGKLRHPHIVTVLDAGVEDELHFIVMEYVPGKTLKSYCTMKSLLPFDDVVEIIFKTASALDYASRQGVIHRDIKPANILQVEGTNVKISDFGTALRENSEVTQIFDAVGSPAYMSPEQISGGDLTFQTDIYSLGVVMYQLLSGYLPYAAKSQVELFRKILNEPPIPLRDRRNKLPEALLKIVENCMAKSPEERYTSWNQLSRDLVAANKQLINVAQDDSDTEKFNILKQLDFFKSFSDRELWEVLRISKWHKFPAGKTLIQEGRVGSSLYILAGGNASIIKNDSFLGVIETGHCFGEMAYIVGNNKPRTASIVSNTEVLVIKIRSDGIENASDQLRTSIHKVLLQILADRLEKTSILASIV
jgi:serine/threonine protein kinase